MKNIICPVCKEALDISNEGKSVKCTNNHLFDFAKQGYLNLLLAQQKKSKSPGDDLLMVQSRTDFLNTGSYSGIAQFLSKQLMSILLKSPFVSRSELNILDLACGEGYYGETMYREISENISAPVNFTGIDISTPAIKNACKRNKEILWLIASTANLPLASSSQDIVTGLFFHFDFNEIERVLKHGGVFIIINTGPNHLIQLRRKIYDKIKEHKPSSFNNIPSNLTHQKTLYFRDKVQIDSSSQLINLLRMTPHYWRATKEKKEQILDLSSLLLDIDVQADVFVKN